MQWVLSFFHAAQAGSFGSVLADIFTRLGARLGIPRLKRVRVRARSGR